MTARAAVIGAGLIAGQHLACLRELEDAETVGVCDLSPSIAESAAERFGVPRWFTDHNAMLDELAPDVVHVLTPPTSHFALAADALAAGANVIIEKPITATAEERTELVKLARDSGRLLVEDYNYVFNGPVQEIFRLIESGEFGEVVHIEATLALDILAPGNPLTDPGAPHPTSRLRGGVIADFLPHLAALAYFFVGPHRAVSTAWHKRSAEDAAIESDEFRALVDAERGTAHLSFSANSRPDAMWLRVHGTRMRASANLHERRLTTDRMRAAPGAVVPLINGLLEARDVARASTASLWSKLGGGPGDYDGLWELVRLTYRSLSEGSDPPVSLEHVEGVNALIDDLTRDRFKL